MNYYFRPEPSSVQNEHEKNLAVQVPPPRAPPPAKLVLCLCMLNLLPIRNTG